MKDRDGGTAVPAHGGCFGAPIEARRPKQEPQQLVELLGFLSELVAGARLRHQNAFNAGNAHDDCNKTGAEIEPRLDPWSPLAAKDRSDRRFIHIAKDIERGPKLTPGI